MTTAGTERSPVGPFGVETGSATQLGWKRRLASGASLTAIVIALGIAAAAMVGVVFVCVALLVSAALN